MEAIDKGPRKLLCTSQTQYVKDFRSIPSKAHWLIHKINLNNLYSLSCQNIKLMTLMTKVSNQIGGNAIKHYISINFNYFLAIA